MIETSSYVTDSMLWSLLYFTVGYLLGRAELYLGTWYRRYHRKDLEVTSPNGSEERPERTILWLRIQGAILAAILVVFGISEAYSSKINAGQDECVRAQITSLTATVETRSALNEREAAATEALITRVAEARKATPADVDEAFRSYAQELKKIQDLRAENPVPPFPTGSCAR